VTDQTSAVEIEHQTRIRVSVTAGSGASVHLSTYPNRTPILSFWNGAVDVSITIPERPRGTEALTFIRDLAASLGEFIAECERLASATEDGDTEPARAA